MGSTRRTLLAGLVLAGLLLTPGSTMAAGPVPIGSWKLAGNLNNSLRTGVDLDPVGTPTFQTKFVGNRSRKVLTMDEPSGVQLRRVPANARSNYSILLTFQIEDPSYYVRLVSWGPSLDDPALYAYNGTLYLYDLEEDVLTTIYASEWKQLLITRDGRTGLLLIYVDRKLRLAWIDREGRFKLSGGLAHFFVDNYGEESPAALAGIRLWRGVVRP